MNINLSLSVEDAQRLVRILNDTRRALSADVRSMLWVLVGEPSPKFNLDDIILMEDLRADVAQRLEDDIPETHFCGYCNSF